MSDKLLEIKNEILFLTKKLNEADRTYYVDSSPIISDSEYDRLFDRLKKLEKEYPNYKESDSPTSRVGSDIDNSLPEKEHSIPVLSLDKCYSLSELAEWINKTQKKSQKKNSTHSCTKDRWCKCGPLLRWWQTSKRSHQR